MAQTWRQGTCLRDRDSKEYPSDRGEGKHCKNPKRLKGGGFLKIQGIGNVGCGFDDHAKTEVLEKSGEIFESPRMETQMYTGC